MEKDLDKHELKQEPAEQEPRRRPTLQQTKRRPGGSSGTSYPRKLPLYETEEGMALLQELARRRGVSAAALIRQLVREEAARVGLAATPVPSAAASPVPSGAAAEREAAEPAGNGERPVINLRELAERARAGDREAEAEMKRVIARLQAETVIVPPQRPGPPDPEWQARFRELREQVLAGVPEEWSEEELQRRVEQEVEAVRRKRARRR